MTAPLTLSKQWRVVRYHASCYTDGNAKLDRSWQQQQLSLPSHSSSSSSTSAPAFSPLIACWNSGDVTLVDLSTGQIVHTVHSDPDDEFTTFALSPSHSLLMTLARRSSMLTLHALSPPSSSSSSAFTSRALSSFKSSPFHSQPITAIAFHPSSAAIATASLDSTIRLFQLPSSSSSSALQAATSSSLLTRRAS
jgi:WD40 repeat protein